MTSSLKEISLRIQDREKWPPTAYSSSSLLHAYVACLSIDDLCTAIADFIGEAAEVRLALRNRLLRLLRDSEPSHQVLTRLVWLVERTSAMAAANKKLKPFVDALHSAIFEYLPLPLQHEVLDRWMCRGTRPAVGRWLKATKAVPHLFDTDLAASTWRASKDARIAKSLAYQGSADVLSSILAELVEECSEGWIISKAALRASHMDEGLWPAIRDKHAATYLYLCARMDRAISDDEAFDIVCSCSGTEISGGRGLAIWSVGQMRKVAVLDRLAGELPNLERRDREEIVQRFAAESQS